MRNPIRLLIVLSLASCGRPPHSAPVPESDPVGFRVAHVSIDTGAVTLAGDMLTPPRETPAPAVILIPGSGAATRNGSWNMYRRIGAYLARRGIAVLLYDKRGVGESTGDWESETFDERAQDVAAMADYLQSRSEIDPEHIGVIGHSQGAYIAPLVAAKYPGEVKFVVLLAGSGEKVWDQILTNERAESWAHGLNEDGVNANLTALERQLRILQTLRSPCRMFKVHYLCFVLDYDPAPALEALTVPTLALYAERDTQVPPNVNVPLVESALETAGNSDYTIRTFDEANHWFAEVNIGTTSEMRELIQQSGLDHYEFVPGFLETIGDWIESHVSD